MKKLIFVLLLLASTGAHAQIDLHHWTFYATDSECTAGEADADSFDATVAQGYYESGEYAYYSYHGSIPPNDVTLEWAPCMPVTGSSWPSWNYARVWQGSECLGEWQSIGGYINRTAFRIAMEQGAFGAYRVMGGVGHSWQVCSTVHQPPPATQIRYIGYSDLDCSGYWEYFATIGRMSLAGWVDSARSIDYGYCFEVY